MVPPVRRTKRTKPDGQDILKTLTGRTRTPPYRGVRLSGSPGLGCGGFGGRRWKPRCAYLWEPDAINPAGGLGSCNGGVPGLAWPWRQLHCEKFQRPKGVNYPYS